MAEYSAPDATTRAVRQKKTPRLSAFDKKGVTDGRSYGETDQRTDGR